MEETNCQQQVRACDVFTPATPARLTFVDRVSLRQRFEVALCTPGKQVVVFGHTGSGKTSLVQHQLAAHYPSGYVVSRCIKGTTFGELVLDAFDQLDAFYSNEREVATAKTASAKFASKYLAIAGELSGSLSRSNRESETRLLPPQLTPQTLGRLMGFAGRCWVLEDFHKLENEEKTSLAQAMKLFMDLADEFRALKIIALGATDTAREVVALDGEMANRVTELYVPLMNSEEIGRIVALGQERLNVHFPLPVRDGIIKYSNGLPAACHQLCLGMCFAAHVYDTQLRSTELGKDELVVSLRNYIEEAADSLKSAFDRALRRPTGTKYDNTRIVLAAVAQHQDESCLPADLLPLIRRTHTEYPAGQVGKFLKELTCDSRANLLRFDRASGRYSFSNPIFQVYASALFHDHDAPRSLDARPNAELMTKMMMQRFVYRGLPPRVVRKSTHKSV